MNSGVTHGCNLAYLLLDVLNNTVTCRSDYRPFGLVTAFIGNLQLPTTSNDNSSGFTHSTVQYGTH
jgi:hypothetical protein